jgi:hypothetical protein
VWGNHAISKERNCRTEGTEDTEVEERLLPVGFFLDLSAVFLRPEGPRELSPGFTPVHPGLSFQPEWALKGPYGAARISPQPDHALPTPGPLLGLNTFFWAIDCPKFCLTSRHSSQGFTLST